MPRKTQTDTLGEDVRLIRRRAEILRALSQLSGLVKTHLRAHEKDVRADLLDLLNAFLAVADANFITSAEDFVMDRGRRRTAGHTAEYHPRRYIAAEHALLRAVETFLTVAYGHERPQSLHGRAATAAHALKQASTRETDD
jgi:hypothetical protein